MNLSWSPYTFSQQGQLSMLTSFAVRSPCDLFSIHLASFLQVCVHAELLRKYKQKQKFILCVLDITERTYKICSTLTKDAYLLTNQKQGWRQHIALLVLYYKNRMYKCNLLMAYRKDSFIIHTPVVVQ